MIPPPLPKPYPGFWQSVALFLLYVLGMLIVIVPAAVVDQIAKTAYMRNPWILGIGTLAGSALALWIVTRRLGVSVREIAGPMRIPGRMLGPMASAIVGQLILTMMMLVWVLRYFPWLLPKDNLGLDKNLLGAAFAVMIAAPLSEEFLFRGIFLRGFLPRYGAARGILLGAAMFAAAHMAVAKVFGTLMLGLIFGWWYSKMGSIWPGVLGHALNNGVPVLAAVLTKGSAAAGTSAAKSLPPFSWAEPVFVLIGIALLAQGLLTMRREFSHIPVEATP